MSLLFALNGANISSCTALKSTSSVVVAFFSFLPSVSPIVPLVTLSPSASLVPVSIFFSAVLSEDVFFLPSSSFILASESL